MSDVWRKVTVDIKTKATRDPITKETIPARTICVGVDDPTKPEPRVVYASILSGRGASPDGPPFGSTLREVARIKIRESMFNKLKEKGEIISINQENGKRWTAEIPDYTRIERCSDFVVLIGTSYNGGS